MNSICKCFKSSPFIFCVVYLNFNIIKRYFNENHFLKFNTIKSYIVTKLYLNEEVYKINPIPGRIYKATENAFYSDYEKKYYSTYLYPLKYVGIYIKRDKINDDIYDIFYDNKEIKIKYTNTTCYKECLKMNENNEPLHNLLFC